MDLYFALQNLAKFSSNHGKVHFGGLVHLFRYIRDSKNSVLKYYYKIEDAPLYELLKQDSNNFENQLMAFYDSSWKYCQNTGRSAGSYIIFYHGGL